MKQISSLLARLNKQDRLGQLTKLRLTQGCQRAGLTEDIWKINKIPETKLCWKDNLACLIVAKARTLGINIRSESDLWTTIGYGAKIREFLGTRLQKKCGTSINETGLIYLNQLLDVKGERLITWQQFKRYQGRSSKGKKAEWFKVIEKKVLERPEGREVKSHFKTNRNNA